MAQIHSSGQMIPLSTCIIFVLLTSFLRLPLQVSIINQSSIYWCAVLGCRCWRCLDHRQVLGTVTRLSSTGTLCSCSGGTTGATEVTSMSECFGRDFALYFFCLFACVCVCTYLKSKSRKRSDSLTSFPWNMVQYILCIIICAADHCGVRFEDKKNF